MVCVYIKTHLQTYTPDNYQRSHRRGNMGTSYLLLYIFQRHLKPVTFVIKSKTIQEKKSHKKLEPQRVWSRNCGEQFLYLLRLPKCRAGAWLAHSRCSLSVCSLHEQMLGKISNTAKEWKEEKEKKSLPPAHPAVPGNQPSPRTGWRSILTFRITKGMALLLPYPQIKANKQTKNLE